MVRRPGTDDIDSVDVSNGRLSRDTQTLCAVLTADEHDKYRLEMLLRVDRLGLPVIYSARSSHTVV